MASEDLKVREILDDPLSQISRSERRNLLIASTVGLFITWTGLIPTKISTFGVELSKIDQQTFLVLVGIVVGYFLIAFVLYGVADFMIWRQHYYDHLVRIEVAIENFSYEEEAYPEHPRDRVPDIGWLFRWSKTVAFLRIGFEYVLPICLASYTVASLLLKAASK